jgi:CcmD family protein
MTESSNLVWVALVTGLIWVGIFAYCLTLDRRIRHLEEGQ